MEMIDDMPMMLEFISAPSNIAAIDQWHSIAAHGNALQVGRRRPQPEQ
jgi:hypothetical protein